MRKLAIILIASMMLCACGSKTTEYYEQHPDEMKAKIEQCKRLSSAEAMADRECKRPLPTHIPGNFSKTTWKNRAREGERSFQVLGG